MRKLFDHNFLKEYTPAEWWILKVCLGIIWFGIVRHAFISPNGVPFPCGICSLINCSALVGAYTGYVFTGLAVVFSLLYIIEKQMRWVTLLMALLSLVCFTLEESNGILNRSSLYTLVFAAQSLAYFRNNANLKTERIQFAVQIIAAGYMLAGIAKMRETGLAWVSDSPQAVLQMLKGYCANYFNWGDKDQLQLGLDLANFALHHSLVVKWLFGFSLIFELFAFLAVKNKARTFVYGLLLTGMHIGIYYFMHIVIVAIFFPMLLFMVNPVYILYLFFIKVKQTVFGWVT